MLSCTEISFVISFFNFEKFWVKPGLSFTKLNRANTQNLEKMNFDMFYKNDWWAVICYPICVTNISYERKIIVLPFPVISFVTLIFVFQIFEIKSGFPFHWLTLYIPPESSHYSNIDLFDSLEDDIIHLGNPVNNDKIPICLCGDFNAWCGEMPDFVDVHNVHNVHSGSTVV